MHDDIHPDGHIPSRCNVRIRDRWGNLTGLLREISPVLLRGQERVSRVLTRVG
jgi:hypothetical protein